MGIAAGNGKEKRRLQLSWDIAVNMNKREL